MPTVTESREERLYRVWGRMISVSFPELVHVHTPETYDPYSYRRIPWIYRSRNIRLYHGAQSPFSMQTGVVVWGQAGELRAVDRLATLERFHAHIQSHRGEILSRFVAVSVGARQDQHRWVMGVQLEDSTLPWGFGNRLSTSLRSRDPYDDVSRLRMVTVTQARTWTASGERYPNSEFDGPTPAADLPGYPDGGDGWRNEPDENNGEGEDGYSESDYDDEDYDDPWGDD